MGALAKTFQGLKGAALAATVAVSPMTAAFADEATPAAQPETQGYSQETINISNALRTAGEYSSEHGVAIVLQIGDDIRNHEQSAAVLAWTQDQFTQRFQSSGETVGIFPVNNNISSTLITYLINGEPYGNEINQGILDLQAGIQSIPDVVEQLNISRQIEAAKVNSSFTPQPNPSNG